jgi:hypothetical protein
MKASNRILTDQLNQHSKSANPVTLSRQSDEGESGIANNSTSSSTSSNWLEIFKPSTAISQVCTPGQYLGRNESAPAAKPGKRAAPPCQSQKTEKSPEENIDELEKDEIKQLKPSWTSAKGQIKGQYGNVHDAIEPCIMCCKVEMLYPVLARELRALSPRSCRRQPATLEEPFPMTDDVIAAVPDTIEKKDECMQGKKILETGSIQVVPKNCSDSQEGMLVQVEKDVRMQCNTGQSGDKGNELAGFLAGHGERMWDGRADWDPEKLKEAREAELTKARLALAESQKRLAQVEGIKEVLEMSMKAMKEQLASEQEVSFLLRAELKDLKKRVEVLDVATQTGSPNSEGPKNSLEAELDLVRGAATVLQERLDRLEGARAEIESENVALKAQLASVNKVLSSSNGCAACSQEGNELEDAAPYVRAAEVIRLKEALVGERERAIQAVMAVREKLADAEARGAELEAGFETMRAQLAREQHTVSLLRVELAIQTMKKAGGLGDWLEDAQAGSHVNGAGSEVVEAEKPIGDGSEWSKSAATSENSLLSHDARTQIDMCKKRLNVGFEKVNALLAGEQEVSSSLRAVLFSLQAQRKSLEKGGSSGAP